MFDPPPDELRDVLRSCLNVDRWVNDIAAAAPFDSLDALLDPARAVAPLSAAEIAEALADHPRIGERPKGEDAAAAFSRGEQASLGHDDQALADAIAAGNAAYESRFGRVFLIRAKGRTRTEILDELHRRLSLEDAAELETVSSELIAIALLRLETVYREQVA